jgi:methylglutaconyl-CoA hydratase
MPVQSIKLRQIADARSGDKGSNANIGIIAHTSEAYRFLSGCLTAEKVQAYFSPLGVQSVTRYELPNLQAFNFLLEGVLGEGGSRSLRLDPQGKALGQILLEMPLEIPLELVQKPYQWISLDKPHDHVLLLTLNRPEKRNALHIELLEEICAALEAAYQSDTRALVIAAAGPSFCSGMDLTEAVDLPKVERSAHLIAAVLSLLVDAPFVTIAAAQGVAAGGGAGLLSACDLVIAADDLKVSYPEVRRGLVPAQVLSLLMRLTPRHLVHELVFLGESWPAEKALAVGLVNRVVALQDVVYESIKVAVRACESAPTAIKSTKKLLRKLDSRSFAEELTLALPYHHASRHSEEAKEGMKAFLEKRPPSWMQ